MKVSTTKTTVTALLSVNASAAVEATIIKQQNNTMRVRWGGVYSSSFTVTNGVRQWGILSPYLFNVYVVDLSVKLNSCHEGCYHNGGCVNHLMYADDLVIMSPSVAGLYKLMHICE